MNPLAYLTIDSFQTSLKRGCNGEALLSEGSASVRTTLGGIRVFSIRPNEVGIEVDGELVNAEQLSDLGLPALLFGFKLVANWEGNVLVGC